MKTAISSSPIGFRAAARLRVSLPLRPGQPRPVAGGHDFLSGPSCRAPRTPCRCTHAAGPRWLRTAHPTVVSGKGRSTSRHRRADGQTDRGTPFQFQAPNLCWSQLSLVLGPLPCPWETFPLPPSSLPQLPRLSLRVTDDLASCSSEAVRQDLSRKACAPASSFTSPPEGQANQVFRMEVGALGPGAAPRVRSGKRPLLSGVLSFSHPPSPNL